MAHRRPIVLDDDDTPALSPKRPRTSSPQKQQKAKVKSSISVDQVYNFFLPGPVNGINSIRFPSRDAFLEGNARPVTKPVMKPVTKTVRAARPKKLPARNPFRETCTPPHPTRQPSPDVRNMASIQDYELVSDEDDGESTTSDVDVDVDVDDDDDLVALDACNNLISYASVIPDQQLPSFDRLTSVNISAESVVRDIHAYDSRLSTKDEQVHALIKRTRDHSWSPFELPEVTQNATTWACSNAEMDYYWNNVVDNTRRVLRHERVPVGYSMEIKHFVKPMGDTNQPLIILSSYSTTTKANTEFATVNDLSNTCIFRLYTKLGLDRPGPATGVLHINDCLIRIDRKVATKVYGASFYTTSRSCVPNALRRVWDDAAFVLLDRSEAAVGLLVGRT
ncbi:hypothetical protein N0V94_001395 [Neodidymelliopsis sp. IMI 364377]|nr:hypothetical protein N0V94_001395 [Neodidymelliopsis sp. IMI 364377]